jgi:uncharacterized membrane protein
MDRLDRARGLSEKNRRRLLRRAVLRPVLITLVLLLAYFSLPLNRINDRGTLALLIGALVGVVAVCAWETYQVLQAEFPGAQALEALAATLSVYLIGYSTVYYLVSEGDPAAFSEPLTRVDALYFCLTVFATVGFGDIVASTDATKAVVSAQMVGNLILIAIGVRLLSAAVKWRQQNRNETA